MTFCSIKMFDLLRWGKNKTANRGSILFDTSFLWPKDNDALLWSSKLYFAQTNDTRREKDNKKKKKISRSNQVRAV